MRWVLLLAALASVLLLVSAARGGQPAAGTQRGRQRRGKRRRGGRGGSGADRTRTLQMRMGPADDQVLEYLKKLDFPALHPPGALPPPYSNLRPVPSDPVTPLTQEVIQLILRHEEEEHRKEEEQLRRKDEERKKRRKQRKEQAERQRKFVEERRREEEEALKLQVEKEEEEWREKEKRRQEAKERETLERRMEEQRRRQEVEESETLERRMEEEIRRQEELLRERLEALEEDNEEEVWLRGDVFQILQNQLEPELPPPPQPIPPTLLGQELAEAQEEVGGGEEEFEVSPALPPGCDISDVTLTCENAQLDHFPPLAIPELKSLSLEGNSIRSIPAEAFNGIQNLEWLNLGKNRITSGGIAAAAFRGLRFLRRLYLDENLLEHVPSDLPSTLQELKINENNLRTINEKSLQGLSSLIILEMEHNLLSETTVEPLAFSSLPQLSYLRLGHNHFRTVPQGLPSTLLELYLENNMIEEISETVFNRTTSLHLVSLRHNRLEETRIAPLAWINLRSLESIDLSHNDLYLVPSYLPRSLLHLVLVGNHIQRIPGYVFAHMEPGLEYLYLSYNKLDGEGTEPESFFGVYHSMVELCLDHNQLLSVPSGINQMNTLHFLRLNDNNIRSIPEESLCGPGRAAESTLVAVRLENNQLGPDNTSPSSFSCVRSAASVVFKPQRKD